MENSISDFIDYLLLEKNYSPHTINSYRTDLKEFHSYMMEFYGLNAYAEISHHQVRSWLTELVSSGVASSSVRRKLSSLKSYFKYLQRNSLIKKNPMEKVTAPKSERKLPNYVDDTTMDFALDTFIPEAKDFNGRKKNMIVLALYHTGMRRAELINLKDSDVDFGQGTLKVLGKRNKERIIPFSGELKRKLSEYIEEKNTLYNSEYVFVTTKGKKMYPKFVYNTVNSFLKQASVSGKKSPHVLRHSFATNLLNKGADLNAIKELLGHSNLSATQIYTQNSIEKLKNIHKLTHPKSRS